MRAFNWWWEDRVESIYVVYIWLQNKEGGALNTGRTKLKKENSRLKSEKPVATQTG